jgi:hypothetical protein
MLTWALITLLTTLSLVRAWEPDYILRVSEQTIYTDCAPRDSVVINGKSPPVTLVSMAYG